MDAVVNGLIGAGILASHPQQQKLAGEYSGIDLSFCAL